MAMNKNYDLIKLYMEKNNMVRIAIDMMGSDLGAGELSKGVINFLKQNNDVFFYLVGNQKELIELFKNQDNSRYEIVNAEKTLPMEIKPLDFLRAKTSSQYIAIQLVKEGKADAVISAGSTGGLVTGASLLLKNIDGVSRGGIISPFPTSKFGKATVILDIGANNTNTPEDLYGFAKMGRLYAKEILNMENPSTYLLSNGTEEGKGTNEIVETYKLLKDRDFPNFKGNAEARNILDGNHDIIVTPGFNGNILLKSIEGTASMMNNMIKDAFKTNLITKIGYLFSRKGFKNMKATMDYRKYGGAIFMGVNGVVIKAHGNSNAYAFYYGLDVAYKMVKSDIVNKIRKEFEEVSNESKAQ